ncbi:lysylphosphatidylglycerol synthase transmembrane domain-containing protein [Streptomyces sp. NBC_01477]|uniref:lysylphosphatidylglycerol synthase transmembrane domain-containing protein n=1 Tax=Streptomyces sp. NBC_01477 TaxID=2976015 RepID=UPI002E3242EA|nr:YbhN family protein [Streptomyces sp. NBC_01477]
MADDTDEKGEAGGAGDPAGPPHTRARHPVWWLVSAALIAAAVLIAVDRRQDLLSARHLIATARPERLAVAAFFEALSLACLAALQWRLLRLGGARLGLGLVGVMIVAANAVAGALPGGAAFAAAWQFGQMRRRRVPPVLAGSVLAVAGLLSGIALVVLLVAGVLAGGTAGPAGVRTAVLWPAAFLVLLTAAGAAASRLRPVRRRAWRLWRRLGVRSRRMWEIEDGLSHLVRRLRTGRPGVRPWLVPFTLAAANWILDAACLAACAWSLDITLPWPGTLVAYTLTQMTGALRLTPGGLGIVETSLAALLVLYGLRADQAIAVTLLYRIASYWALQPIGWAGWLGLTIAARRRARDGAGGHPGG